jgi:hypothetical protein
LKVAHRAPVYRYAPNGSRERVGSVHSVITSPAYLYILLRG